jgi:hypothetical protein
MIPGTLKIQILQKSREEKNAVLSELQGADPGKEIPLSSLPEGTD